MMLTAILTARTMLIKRFLICKSSLKVKFFLSVTDKSLFLF